jgi:hypothetical protein
MLIFVVQTLQNKWNEICMKQLASGKHTGNDYFMRTLKFEMNSKVALDVRWYKGVDNFKWTTLRVVWSMNKDGRF